MTNIYSVVDYGADPTGSADSATAINNAITACGTAGGGTVYFPGGTYKASSTVQISYDSVVLQGASRHSAVIKGDLSVTPIIRIGTTSTTVFHCGIKDLTVSRAAGTIPGATFGIYWQSFVEGFEYNTQSERSYVNRMFDGKSSSAISYDYDGHGLTSYDTTGFQMQFANAAGMHFYGGDIGILGNQTGDTGGQVPQATLLFTSVCNDVTFIGTNLFPRCSGGISSTDMVRFSGMTNSTGVYKFINCNCENVLHLFTSDSTTTAINVLQIVGGWYVCGGNAFALDAATKIGYSTIANNSIASPNAVYLDIVDPQSVAITGNYFGISVRLTGGASARAAVNGNIFLGTNGLDLSGAWTQLAVVGNVFPTTFTTSATGTFSIGANSPNTHTNI